MADLPEELGLLTELSAPSGFEEPVLDAARSRLRPWSQSVELDRRGNLYAVRSGPVNEKARTGLSVMLTAHADEIGLMVTSVHPLGFLKFTRIGYPAELALPGQRVRVLSRTGPLEGLIGLRPAHLGTADSARLTPPISQMYIDIGAESAEQVRSWGVEPGTPVVLVGELTTTRNPHRLFGKTIDNRIGVWLVCEVARRLHELTLNCQVTYVITVEEEIGLRGAAVAAEKVRPDILLAIDTVPCGGTPDVNPEELPWDIGRGPLIKVRENQGLMTHRPLRELIRSVADRHRLPYQWIVDTAGITDATSAQQATGNTAAAVLGLARRYAHSAVELFDLRDLIVHGWSAVAWPVFAGAVAYALAYTTLFLTAACLVFRRRAIQ